MKTLKKIMMAMFVMACMGLTVSCEKDNNNGQQGGGDSGNYSTLILGTWQVDRMSYNGMSISGEQLIAMMGNIQLTFNAGGTGLLNHNGETQNNDFRWSISGNTLTVTPHNDTTINVTIVQMTSTECTWTASDIEMMGQEMEGQVEIHMVKVGDNPNPQPDPQPDTTVNRDLLLGTWQINAMTLNGQDMSSMVAPMHVKIHLEGTGAGVISMSGVEYPFTWTLTGNVLNINTGNETINATITSQTADQVVFTSNNMSFPGIGTLPGEANITLVRYNGDEPGPGPNPDPNPDPVTGELTGTSWGFNYNTTITEEGQTINITITMLLSFTTSTTGTLTETISAMGYSDTENIDFTYTYNVSSHTGTMTATVTDPETHTTETQTLPFTYNPTTNTISVTNPNPGADDGLLPQTIELYRISK